MVAALLKLRLVSLPRVVRCSNCNIILKRSVMKQTTLGSFFTAKSSQAIVASGNASDKPGDVAKPPQQPDVLKETNNVRRTARAEPFPATSANTDQGAASKLKRLRKAAERTTVDVGALHTPSNQAAVAVAATGSAATDPIASSKPEEYDQRSPVAPAIDSAASSEGRQSDSEQEIVMPKRRSKKVRVDDTDSSPATAAKSSRRSTSPSKSDATGATDMQVDRKVKTKSLATPKSPVTRKSPIRKSKSPEPAIVAADLDTDDITQPKSHSRQPSVGRKSKSESGRDTDVKDKAASKKLSGMSKPTVKVDGVGALGLAAAGQHEKFEPDASATWAAGKPVPFSFLANTFEAIAGESKRLVITGILINAFRTVIATTPEDLLPLVYLCTDRVAPPHEGLELGLGDATLIKALAQSTGRKETAIKKEYDETGDLGVVAANARTAQKTMFKPAPLTVCEVFQVFKDIATAEGAKSQERKKGLIVKLMVASKENEAGYIIRALQGKLRIGLADQTVLAALGQAVSLQRDGSSSKDGSLAGRLAEAEAAVKQAYSECPSFDELIPALLKYGTKELADHVHFTPGVPVRPMLAKPTTGVTEVLDKFQGIQFTCEYKYDGERAQVHVLTNGAVKIYSRNAENNTGKFPDLVGVIPRLVKEGVSSIVFDAEAVAFDRVENKILPFQVLSTRARKDVKVEDIKVQVCLFVFDCLYLNGEAMLRRPLTERREAMHTALREEEGKLQFAKYKTSTDTEELQLFLDESVAACTEGLIVKTMNDTYEPSKRSNNWLKLKKDYMEGVGDTFDVVPVGAWYGKGKRTGAFGAFLLAVYNPAEEDFQTISKIGTGFSEEQIKTLSDSLREHSIPAPKPYYRYGESLVPDVWVNAAVVWEVKAADLSISPVHQAARGMADPQKGISIRFPRLVRVRDDKSPEDATTAEQVYDMYCKQATTMHTRKAAAVDDD